MRRRLLPVGVVLAAVASVSGAATAGSGAVPSACGPAAARAAVRESAPRLQTLGPDPVLVSPAQVDRVLCGDTTGDGLVDMAVSIASGGTAGDVGYLLFRRAGARWVLARKGTGYKLGLFRRGARIEVVQPVYGRSDPNCCPTGGFDHVLLGWRDGRYVAVRAWHTTPS